MINCTTSLSVSSVNDSTIATSSSSSSLEATQQALALKVYYGAVTSTVQILDVTVGVVGFTDNLLALIVFLGHKPLLKRPANYFLVSQCSINLLASIALILMIMIDGSSWSPSLVVPMCYLWNSRAIVTGLFLSAVYNIALLTVERYLEIVHPIRHHVKISKGKVIAGIVLGTLAGIVTKACLSYPSVQVIRGVCTIANYPTVTATQVAVVANFLVEYFIPIVIFTFCYASMARALRRSAKVIQPGSGGGDAAAVTVKPIDQQISRARRNIIKTLFIVVLGFVICTSFKQLLLLINIFGEFALNLSGVTFNAAQFLAYLNCCNDPFIYAFNYEEFRVGLRKLFCRFRSRPRQSGFSTTNVETTNN